MGNHRFNRVGSIVPSSDHRLDLQFQRQGKNRLQERLYLV